VEESESEAACRIFSIKSFALLAGKFLDESGDLSAMVTGL
jgi:hypothetical protein